MQWAGEEKRSHLSNKTETKLSMTNLFPYLWSYKSSIPVTMINEGNNNAYKNMEKREIKINIMKNRYDFLQYEILEEQ